MARVVERLVLGGSRCGGGCQRLYPAVTTNKPSRLFFEVSVLTNDGRDGLDWGRVAAVAPSFKDAVHDDIEL